MREMRALLWRDYVCPWCYLARDRTRLLEQLGVEVVPMAFELHPEIPPEGAPVRPGGRLDAVLERIGEECAQAGMAFTKPTRSPNTHRVLQLSEIVRLHQPEHFEAFDDACYRAHWVEGRDLGDRDELDALLRSSGAEPDAVAELFAEGVGAEVLAASMQQAREVGVTATPAWWVDERLLIPGAQPRDTIERWVTRLIERAER